MNETDHRAFHREIHWMIDRVVAAWIAHTRQLPSQHTVQELMEWAYRALIDGHAAPGDEG